MEFELYLSPFAPIVQFLAGIYLLFTYEKIIEKSPIKESQNNVANEWSIHMASVQGLISDELYDRGESKGNEIKQQSWEKNVAIIRSMSFFMLLCCCFLLLFMGGERYIEYSSSYLAFQMWNIIAIICCLLIFCCDRFRKKCYVFFCFFMPMVIFFVVFNCFNDYFVGKGCCINAWSLSWTTKFCVFIVFVPIILVFLKVFYDWIKLPLWTSYIREVEQNKTFLVNRLVDPNAKIPERLQDKIYKKAHDLLDSKMSFEREDWKKIMIAQIEEDIKQFIEASFFSLFWHMICKKTKNTFDKYCTEKISSLIKWLNRNLKI